MTEDGTRILLVDDEEAILKLLRFPLEKEGYQVVTAKDGAEALDTFARESFDLIILDLMLPNMPGLEIRKKIRSRGNKAHVLILTAKDTVEDRVEGLDLGADHREASRYGCRTIL